MNRLEKLADRLDEAARCRCSIAQLSADDSLTIDDAYRIQSLSVDSRLKRGETIVGIKMGFTSRAKMEQMGVDDLIWGRLTDQMIIEEGGHIALSEYVHPRVEPEIAFRLKRPLCGVVSLPEAMAAVEAISPAMEIIDSRYDNFRFNLADVIADNSSSSGFVVGSWQRPQLDISNLGMVLEINGRSVQIGSSAAILGHPARSLVSAARLAAQAGMTLQPGWIILAGAATAAETLCPGMYVRAEVQNLGSASFSVREHP